MIRAYKNSHKRTTNNHKGATANNSKDTTDNFNVIWEIDPVVFMVINMCSLWWSVMDVESKHVRNRKQWVNIH